LASLPSVISKIAAKFLGSVAAKSVGMPLLEELTQAAVETAVEILTEEMVEVKEEALHLGNEKEVARVLAQYFRAARDDRAETNLRLMARAIARLAVRDRLYADEARKYFDILSQLSRDEIYVIGVMYRHLKAARAQGKDGSEAQIEAYKRLHDELVPPEFVTQLRLDAVLSSASRSGLVMAGQTTEVMGMYIIPPLMDEMFSDIDFSSVVAGHRASRERRAST
jgi:hypothetical protein